MSSPLSPIARRAFWGGLYARRRLYAERAQLLAPWHYALIGERRGYRPNAFFDPGCYGPAAAPGARGLLLERYLADPSSTGPSPSREFDHAWYCAQNPDWARTHPHPFLHFLEGGLREGRRPRADIDLAFVRDVVRAKPVSLEAAAFRVFDRAAAADEPEPALCAETFLARQDRFAAQARPRIERVGAGRRRRFLVFVQAAPEFDAPYLAEPRDYDVLLNCYREGSANPKAETVVFQAGTKTTAIRRLLEVRPELLLAYDVVLFLDDDVEMSKTAIEALFATMTREGLDLAQPALTADSQTHWTFLKSPQVGAGVLRASSVEIMAPALSRRALEAVGWTFAESVSGWGTDLLLGPAVRAAFGGEGVGVVGAALARHARALDPQNGALYALLRRNGVNPWHEANRVAAVFGVERGLRALAAGEAGPVCRVAPPPRLG